jgi:hypothetical protein
MAEKDKKKVSSKDKFFNLMKKKMPENKDTTSEGVYDSAIASEGFTAGDVWNLLRHGDSPLKSKVRKMKRKKKHEQRTGLNEHYSEG